MLVLLCMWRHELSIPGLLVCFKQSCFLPSGEMGSLLAEELSGYKGVSLPGREH